MATMHHLSVITNSCVKRPVNPKTGLIVTSGDRITNPHNTWNDVEAYYGSDMNNTPDEYEVIPQEDQVQGHNSGLLFQHTDTMLDNVTALDGLDDDEFYLRLLELKEEHKKTLEMCEKLYQEKILTPQRSEQGTELTSQGKSPSPYLDLRESDRIARSSNEINSDNGVLDHSRDSANRRLYMDNVRDLSASKPPTGRPPSSQGRPQSAKLRPSSTTKAEGRAWNEFSFDETYWKPPPSSSTTDREYSDLGDEEYSARRALFDSSNLDSSRDPVSLDNTAHSKNKVTSRIEDMWDNFSLEDYASPRRRPRSASLSRVSSASKEKEKVEDWQNKITVPKPFKMTLREKEKLRTQSKNLLEFEEQRRKKEEEEDLECQKKFKATPVPAHVYMPLFGEIMEEKEARRRMVREHCEELLKSQEKPFKFMKREEEKQKYHSQKRTNSLFVEDNKQKGMFKAKPFPQNIFDDTVEERIKEEEQYRKIKMQMRALEMLKSSSIPPNMAARGEDYFKGKSRQKTNVERAKKAGIYIEERFHPEINDAVPDFEALHRQFQQGFSRKKAEKEATVCKPFNLQTSRIPSKKHRVYDDIKRDEETLRENRWPFKNPRARPSSGSSVLSRSLSGSLDSIPTKMTAAAELRKSTNESRIRQQMEFELQQLEYERQRRQKERGLKKVISKRAAANDSSVDIRKTSKDKLKEYRESERRRQEEYRQQLHEMMGRVDSRPLLFERTAQNNAKMRAEKKYRETLLRTGVDEDYVVHQGSAARSIKDLGSGSEDEDDSYSDRSWSPCGDGSARQSYSNSVQKSYSHDFDDSDAKTNQDSDIDEVVIDD